LNIIVNILTIYTNYVLELKKIYIYLLENSVQSTGANLVVLTIADIAEVVVHYFLHLVQEISVPSFLVFFKKKMYLEYISLKIKIARLYT